MYDFIITKYNQLCADVPTLLGEESPDDSQQFGWRGQRRHFTCSATALPLPTITWSRSGGLFVVDSDTYRVNTTTQQLTVTSTLEVAVYCVCLSFSNF